MPAGASHRRAATEGREVIVGYRASRKYGLSAYTVAHLDESRALVSAVCEFVPEATFNAMALVRHGTTPTHRDKLNNSSAEMFLLPQTPEVKAWIWVESSTGNVQVVLDGEAVFGSWHPYDRVLCFPAGCAHKVHAIEMGCSLVLYRTARPPLRKHLSDLVHSGFPLSVAELAQLDLPDGCAPDSVHGGTDGDDCLDKTYAETDGDVKADVPLCASGDDRIAPEADCVKQKHLPDGAVVESISLFKAKPDGYLREILLQTTVGTTVAQAIITLKGHLHLHPGKIMSWLLMTYYLARTPIRVRSTSSRPAPLPASVQCAAGPPSLQCRPLPIGARVPKAEPCAAAVAQSAALAAVCVPPAASSSGSTTSPAVGVDAAVAELQRLGIVSTPFEIWMASRLLQIESQQAQVVDRLARGASPACAVPHCATSQSRPRMPSAYASASGARVSTASASAGAPQKPAIGSRFLQGGAGGGHNHVRLPRPFDVTTSGNVVLFVPCSDVLDTLMHCVRWILVHNGWKSDHAAADAHVYLRTVARAWIASAYRNNYPCAGLLITALAHEFDCTPEIFIDQRCCPSTIASPAFVIVYALSCLFATQMFVLDSRGRRMDSFIVSSGWGLQWFASSWLVVSAFPRVRPSLPCPASPTSISSTLSWHDDMSVSSESLFEVVHGAGKVHRVQQEALSVSTYELVVKDLKSHGKGALEPKLIRHVLDHDKKCVLACFQSRTSAQRLRAFAAGLKRMGLSEQADGVAQASPASAAGGSGSARADAERAPAPANPLPKPSSGSNSLFDGNDSCHRTVSRSVEHRLASLEVWAHAFDSTNGDENTTGAAAAQAHELLSAMAKQAFVEQHTEVFELIHSRLTSLEEQVADCLSFYRRSEADSVPQLFAGAGGVFCLPDVAERFAALTHKVDLCMRLCKRGLTSTSWPGLTSTPNPVQMQLSQISELLRVHTIAISRSWQWIYSLVQVPMHTVASRACDTPVQVPPPPPARPGASGCGEANRCAAMCHGVSTPPPSPCMERRSPFAAGGANASGVAPLSSSGARQTHDVFSQGQQDQHLNMKMKLFEASILVSTLRCLRRWMESWMVRVWLMRQI
eukprot:1660065-Amphidinium_carterae.1